MHTRRGKGEALFSGCADRIGQAKGAAGLVSFLSVMAAHEMKVRTGLNPRQELDVPHVLKCPCGTEGVCLYKR